MPVTNVRKDLDALTMHLDAEFEASPDRVWQLWADPRQLEQWWGPPEYPATVTEHDLRPGGIVRYHMTGPEGEEYHGFWEVGEVDEPTRLVLHDGFADADGTTNEDMPGTHTEVSIDGLDDGRTRMTIASTFPDLAGMEQVLSMGMEEGLRAAVGQIDAILADDAANATVPG